LLNNGISSSSSSHLTNAFGKRERERETEEEEDKEEEEEKRRL